MLRIIAWPLWPKASREWLPTIAARSGCASGPAGRSARQAEIVGGEAAAVAPRRFPVLAMFAASLNRRPAAPRPAPATVALPAVGIGAAQFQQAVETVLQMQRLSATGMTTTKPWRRSSPRRAMRRSSSRNAAWYGASKRSSEPAFHSAVSARRWRRAAADPVSRDQRRRGSREGILVQHDFDEIDGVLQVRVGERRIDAASLSIL